MNERLEEIKHYWYIENMIDKEDVGWLIQQAERVQELERANKQLEKQAPGIELDLLNMELTVALKQNKRYREALEEIRGLYPLRNVGYQVSGIRKIVIKALEGEE